MSRAATLTQGLPNRGTTTIAIGGVLTAALAGVALATDVPKGMAVVCAALYLPLVVLNLPLGVALWVPLVFLDGLPAFNLAGKAAGLLLIIGWIGALRSGTVSVGVLSHHRRLVGVLIVVAVWLSLSLLWARDLMAARSDIWHWWAVVTLFVVVATSVASRSAITLVCTTFVVGALASVVVSYALGGTANASERLEVATANPNALAAGVVPAIALAAALTAIARGVVARWLLAVTIAVLIFGLIASQSRGGLVAVCAAGLTALIVLRHRRRQVVALVLIAVGVATVSFMLDPTSWQRIASDPGRGSGRLDLWTVAWNMAGDHPVAGVGLNNYTVVAPDYVRRVGPLQRVDLVADQPHVVHNLYLQLLAEIGIVGLVCFVVFAIGCLYAAWRAARLCRLNGVGDLEALANGILIGTVGMLGCFVFGSNGVDRRLWVLLALGPAVLEVARRVTEQTALAPGGTRGDRHAVPWVPERRSP